MKLRFETPISCSFARVKSGFDRNLFEALRPPWIRLKLKRFDGCSPGNEVHLEMGQFGFYQTWISHITEEKLTEKNWYFVDVGYLLPWPIKKWKHVHMVQNISEHKSLIIDDIDYDCGSKFLNVLMWPGLWISFAIRPKIYKKFFEG